MASPVPDPFFLDDDDVDDPLSARLPTPALVPSPSRSPKPPTPSLGLQPPRSIRGLRVPSLFLPIPSADPLTPLLGKFVPHEFRPHRDVTGEFAGREDRELIMSNSWRALARKCETRIRNLPDTETETILNLWYLRLHSLARMRLYNQATVECSNLWAALESAALSEPTANPGGSDLREYIFSHLVPFELLVFRARTSYFVKDAYEYLDQLLALRKDCLKWARGAESVEDVEVWKERFARVGLMIASQLIEMQDFRGAQKILTDLSSSSQKPSAALLSSLGRLQLEAGDIQSAAVSFEQSASTSTDPSSGATDAALLAIARGEWTKAYEMLKGVLGERPDDIVSIDVLENVLRTSPSALVVAEPLVFNLVTLYELRSSTAGSKKRDLLIETAKWSGDGFRAAALKMS